MRRLTPTNQFKKDIRRLEKRRKPLSKIQTVLEILVSHGELPPGYKPHKLSGDYDGFWDCHIEPDWILIYQVDDEVLTLYRTGSHADLFK